MCSPLRSVQCQTQAKLLHMRGSLLSRVKLRSTPQNAREHTSRKLIGQNSCGVSANYAGPPNRTPPHPTPSFRYVCYVCSPALPTHGNFRCQLLQNPPFPSSCLSMLLHLPSHTFFLDTIKKNHNIDFSLSIYVVKLNVRSKLWTL